MNGLPVDHIAIAVSDLSEAATLHEALNGARSSTVEELPSQGVRVCFVGAIELLQPLGPETTVARFLERHGPGIHHIAYRTEDIRSELARLKAEGFRLIDEVPRPGAGGHLVAFLHPKSTGGALIELVQHGG